MSGVKRQVVRAMQDAKELYEQIVKLAKDTDHNQEAIDAVHHVHSAYSLLVDLTRELDKQ